MCFPRVLKARLQKPSVFLCFESEHGLAGSDLTPPVLYQIRQNPYSESTVWGINTNQCEPMPGRWAGGAEGAARSARAGDEW